MIMVNKSWLFKVTDLQRDPEKKFDPINNETFCVWSGIPN